MKRIIHPTDFSKTADTARDFAIYLANKTKSEVVFINTYEIPPSQSTVITTTLLETMKENSQQGLDELAEYMKAHHPEVTVSYHSVLGQTVSSICDISEQLEADLIVMGTHGASGLEEVFIGSVAQAVIKNSKIPVLAVPKHANPKDIHKIAYSSDLNFSNVEKAHQLIENMVDTLDSKLHIIHFSKTAELHEDSEEYIFKRFEKLDPKYDEIPLENYDKDIQEYIDFTRVEMLCMIQRPHNFFERLFLTSHSEKRAMHTNIPLLVLKEG
jgi:nucleotide-binding universal stress UspA family protein